MCVLQNAKANYNRRCCPSRPKKALRNADAHGVSVAAIATVSPTITFENVEGLV